MHYVYAAVPAGFAVLGLAGVVLGVIRKDAPGSTRVLLAVLGTIVALAGAYMTLVWLYLAGCESAMNCL